MSKLSGDNLTRLDVEFKNIKNINSIITTLTTTNNNNNIQTYLSDESIDKNIFENIAIDKSDLNKTLTILKPLTLTVNPQTKLKDIYTNIGRTETKSMKLIEEELNQKMIKMMEEFHGKYLQDMNKLQQNFQSKEEQIIKDTREKLHDELCDEIINKELPKLENEAMKNLNQIKQNDELELSQTVTIDILNNTLAGLGEKLSNNKSSHKIPIFYGKIGEDAEVWWKKVLLNKEALNWSDKKTLSTIKIMLDERALDWNQRQAVENKRKSGKTKDNPVLIVEAEKVNNTFQEEFNKLLH